MGFMWAEGAKEPRTLQVHKHTLDHLCLDGWKVEVDLVPGRKGWVATDGPCHSPATFNEM